MAGWIGRLAGLLEPLSERIERHVRAGLALHADDTPVPVLDPGRGKTKTGRLWTVVRDERPFGATTPPAAFYRYSPDRKAEHAHALLAGCRGFLHADGYAGFGDLYKPEPETGVPRLTEVACWAHARRKIYDVFVETGSPAAREALEGIARLFAVEADIRGRGPAERREVRQRRSAPMLADLKAFLDATLAKISGKSSLAGAIRYATSRWAALTRFVDDGRLEMTNNAAERAIRPLATGLSLCTSLSSVWKHWKLVFVIDATRATCSPDRGDYHFMLQVGSPDLVRSARHDLFSAEDAVPDEPTDAMVRDAERRSGLRHREPLAVLLGGAVGVDAVHPPQRADTVRRPSLSLARGHSHSVQRRGDVLVRPSGRHAPHHGEGLFGRAATMLAGLRLVHPQLRVLAASPMDRQDDLARRLVDVGDDVVDKGAEQPLACPHGHAGRVPCGIEILGQPGEVGRRGDRIRRPHGLYSRLARLDAA